MFASKEMLALGIPNRKNILSLALRLTNTAVSKGEDRDNIRQKVKSTVQNPSSMVGDGHLSQLASVLQDYNETTPKYDRSAPLRIWGRDQIDEQAVLQMENACRLPHAVRGALMPDAHTGYGLPIGGVLAMESVVIPYAVGVDIACRMRLSVLDLPVSSLEERHDSLVEAIERQTRFGMGAGFEISECRQHAVMDEDWSILKGTGATRDKAWKQLGSSGGGNHFVEFGELHVEEAVHIGGQYFEAGIYSALLSHSGSRGSGEAVASFYSKLAMDMHDLPQELRHLAWLDMESEAGQAYWAAMQLMGRYASANHELIHGHILGHLGVHTLSTVENHHNFAWKEVHDGREVIVHRKGATPAGSGVEGIVPGSMGSPGFVVRGRGNGDSLHSCSHGAGRRMSRNAALKELDRNEMENFLRRNRVELVSGGLDESPQAYKDIRKVMEEQSSLVSILARFEPRIVKMAPGQRSTSRNRR